MTDRKIIAGLKSAIRSVPDFPKKGILFRDITTLIKDGHKFKDAVELIAGRYKKKRIDKVIAVVDREMKTNKIMPNPKNPLSNKINKYPLWDANW